MTNGLQSKAARMQDVDLEVKQLRETLAEYNEEFRQVRNQGRTPNEIYYLISFLFLFLEVNKGVYYVCSFYRFFFFLRQQN
jgi:hypothetical protein